MKIWMTMKDFAKYEELRSEMQSLPAKLRGRLGDASAIGCQRFIGHTSELAWSKFIAANDGTLPKEVADWQKWERLSSTEGYCRFFGRGSLPDLDIVKEVFRRGDEILKEYDALHPVLERLEWKLPEHWGYYPDEQPDHESLLQLLTEFAGHDGDGTGILLEEAGMDVVKTFDTDDPLPFAGPPDRLTRVGLGMHCFDDLAAALWEAVCKWLEPYDRDWAIFQIQKAEAEPKPVPPMIENIIINTGHRGLQLTSGGVPAYPVPSKYTLMFAVPRTGGPQCSW